MVRYSGVLGVEEPHQSIPNLVVKLYCGERLLYSTYWRIQLNISIKHETQSVNNKRIVKPWSPRHIILIILETVSLYYHIQRSINQQRLSMFLCHGVN
jgi:hypothetical protein